MYGALYTSVSVLTATATTHAAAHRSMRTKALVKRAVEKRAVVKRQLHRRHPELTDSANLYIAQVQLYYKYSGHI